jgi:hypothetical protein
MDCGFKAVRRCIRLYGLSPRSLVAMSVCEVTCVIYDNKILPPKRFYMPLTA